jgi:hypothetical protein
MPIEVNPHSLNINIPYDGRRKITGEIKCWEQLNKGDEVKIEYDTYTLYGKITSYNKQIDTYFATWRVYGN